MDSEDKGSSSSWMNESIPMMKGLESLSDGVEEEDTSGGEDGVEEEDTSGWEDGYHVGEEGFATSNEGIGHVDSMEDIMSMDLNGVSPHELRNVDFASREVAFEFYSWYSRLNGFAARKSKVIRNKQGNVLQQTFVCYREGHREDRGLKLENRKRVPKKETRCGCRAQIRVHIDILSQRWHVTCFKDRHNHELLNEKYHGMLARHRRMSASDIMQMNNMLKAGINPPQIYGSFACQSGGYENVGFRMKDIYNQIGRQRRLQESDTKSAMKYLRELASEDPMLFYCNTIDDEGRLEHLFWSDGMSRIDYQVFGDVLAFDATYGKNKYHCPLVVFSGVNNHNVSTVFAGAIVANEREETYVWVLQQFLEAMSGKPPLSVITDGDVPMRNAIRKVFPSSYHRLCAWHLIRNAASNVGIPAFVGQFRRLMLGDYDVGKFHRKWYELLDTFGLHGNSWVTGLYAKRKMWATAHIRGNFFAGFRTTSRCEGLHSELGKFVHSRLGMNDFLRHFFRALNYMRHKEIIADFETVNGELKLQTNFASLEKCGEKIFTTKLFLIFRDLLGRSSGMVVIGCKETCNYFIFIVSKYQMSAREWRVSFYPDCDTYKCSCQRMESFGLPCSHILAVLVHLRVAELPRCLVLDRWTKNAKTRICDLSSVRPKFWDSHVASRYGALMFQYRRLSKLASESGADFIDHMEHVSACIQDIESNRGVPGAGSPVDEENIDHGLRDPASCRSKGRGGASASTTRNRPTRVTHCSICGKSGHNRKTCAVRKMTDNTRPNSHGHQSDDDSIPEMEYESE